MRKTIAALGSALVIAALGVSAAFAIEQPDAGVVLNDVDGYTGMLEAGDLLVLAEYDIPYATIPSDFNAGESFILNLKTSAGTIVGTHTPYPFNESGYNRGVVSIYLAAAQVTAAGFTWPFSDDGMTVQLVGNPTIFAPQPTSSVITLAGGQFQSTSMADVNESALETEILSVATTLQQQWQVTLLDGSSLLNDSGTQYFTLAIPGLRNMVDRVFAISTESPLIPTPITGTGSYASDVTDRYSGNAVADTPFDSLATDTGIDSQVWKGILFMLGVVAFAGFAAVRHGGGAAMGAIGFSTIVGLPIAVDQGFVAWAFGALIIAVIVTYGLVKGVREMVSA